MGTLLRFAVVLGVIAAAGGPASAQSGRCSHDELLIDAIPVVVRLCVPLGAAAPSVTVTETFSAAGKIIQKTIALVVVAGARTSRTIDDVDLAPLGVKRSLHMTLAFRAGAAELEHALALPGAIPLK